MTAMEFWHLKSGNWSAAQFAKKRGNWRPGLDLNQALGPCTVPAYPLRHRADTISNISNIFINERFILTLSLRRREKIERFRAIWRALLRSHPRIRTRRNRSGVPAVRRLACSAPPSVQRLPSPGASRRQGLDFPAESAE